MNTKEFQGQVESGLEIKFISPNLKEIKVIKRILHISIRTGKLYQSPSNIHVNNITYGFPSMQKLNLRQVVEFFIEKIFR